MDSISNDVGGVGYATMVAVVMASEIDESGINRLKINEVGRRLLYR